MTLLLIGIAFDERKTTIPELQTPNSKQIKQDFSI
jgi:hypothetical protein